MASRRPPPTVDLIPAVAEAAARLAPHVVRTPVRRAPELDPEGGEAWLKLECLQRTGSFKLRGATNKMLTLSEEARSRGVVTASSGNHGKAVASAGQRLGIRARVFVPEGASRNKIASIRDLGAEVVVFGADFVDAEALAQEEAASTGAVYVSAYNDPDVVAGQGTVGFELSEQVTGLDAVFVAVGGGGLISGTAAWLKLRRPDLLAVACSPANSPVLHRSLEAGHIVHMESLPTLSDGTAGGLEDGAITFPLAQRLVDRSLLVSEGEIAAAMRHVEDHHSLVIEGSAGVAVAGWQQLRQEFAGQRVAIVLCGGNV